ncbi:MAG: alpha-2-macroglobulin family protein, partial [Planctomycetota bacterium]
GRDATTGRPYLRQGYEAFLTADRGVYRPGDRVRLAALLRGVDRSVPPSMPMDLLILRPDGRELTRLGAICDGAGRITESPLIPRAAASGRYTVACTLPGETDRLGETSFRVADYIPHTLKLTVTAPEKDLSAQDRFTVTAQAQHLFGDPAVGLTARLRAHCRSIPFAPKHWNEFRFGDQRRKHTEKRLAHLGQQVLDKDGRTTLHFTPPALNGPAAMQVRAEVEVLEKGGRALCESVTRTVHPWPSYLGVKPPTAAIRPDEAAAFDLIAVRPNGSLETTNAAWTATLARVRNHCVLRRGNDGLLRYEWNRSEERESKLSGNLSDGGGQIQLTPKRPGRYRLVITMPGSCPVVTDFTAHDPSGLHASDTVVTDPESLDLQLDRKAYRPGEEATVRFQSPFAGTALVCVESDRVLQSEVLPIEKGLCEWQIPVQDSWRPNVFITATLIRPVRPETTWMPHRTSGAIRLRVNCRDRQLRVAIQTPKKVRPATPLTVNVSVSNADGSPRAGAAVILAAVDEGVLALTDYRPTDPWDFFYADRALGVRELDMYSRLAPELARWKLGKTPEPGGGGAPRRKQLALSRRLNPIQAKRVRTAVLYSGNLLTDATGTATARFTLPEYLGQLRLMAFAAGDDAFGLKEKALTVKSPIMLRASWPRFLAPGDRFQIPITLFNRTSSAGELRLEHAFDGPLQAEEKNQLLVSIPAGGEKTIRLRLRALNPGKATVRLMVRLGDETYSESLELPVRPAAAFRRSGGHVILRGGASQTLQFGGGYLPGTSQTSLTLSSNPLVELTGALDYLLRYPYGCIEQTTSRMIPLLYLRDLAAMSRPDSIGSGEVEELLEAGFLRLEMMQTYSGGLSMWPQSGQVYDWGTLYAGNMLVEAKRAGFTVPQRLLGPLLNYAERELRQWLNGPSPLSQHRLREAAYACLLLTRAGRKPVTHLARLDELLRPNPDSKTPTPSSARFHLAAAYLALGEHRAATEFLSPPKAPTTTRTLGSSLASPVREQAIHLQVLLDAVPNSPHIPRLVRSLRNQLKRGRWGTTQENAFTLMALGKYCRRNGEAPKGTIHLSLPDGSVHAFPAGRGKHFDTLAPGAKVALRFEGTGNAHAFWSAEGVPSDGTVEEEDRGLQVQRLIMNAEGKRFADPGALKQGRLYQIALRFTAGQRVENIAVTDLLPAGFEIENAGLRGASQGAPTPGWSWLRPEHVERRDDRLLL